MGQNPLKPNAELKRKSSNFYVINNSKICILQFFIFSVSLYRVYSYSFCWLFSHSHHIVTSASSKTFEKKKKKIMHLLIVLLAYKKRECSRRRKKHPSQVSLFQLITSSVLLHCLTKSDHAYVSFTLWRKQHKTVQGRQASQHKGS